MRKAFYILSLILLASCQGEKKFTIKGIVEGAEGETIYLEHEGLMKTDMLDSCKVNGKGEFHFNEKSPVYPDFYRLSLLGKQIHLAADSTETIEISTSLDQFGDKYTVSGSESNQDILLLRKSVINIQKELNKLVKGMDNASRVHEVEKIKSMIETHKALARPIILKNPRSTAAYFAIYQQLNNSYIFTPYAAEDRPYCSAVATSYNTFMPDYERSKNLYNLVMDAIRRERQSKSDAYWKELMDKASSGYIDITLPDKDANPRKLSDLQGKVILLDFSAYESRESVSYTFALRDLYNSYATKGLEIFQVSLDRSKLYWQESTRNIPWICVRDENGPNTPYAGTYNIQNLPTYFLINRKGEIVGRDMDLKTLKREIEKAL